MKLDPSTFVRSVAGKAVLATGIVLLAYGGAAAAGFTEVPELIPQSTGNPSLEPETSDDSSSVETTDESSSQETDVELDASSSDDDQCCWLVQVAMSKYARQWLIRSSVNSRAIMHGRATHVPSIR